MDLLNGVDTSFLFTLPLRWPWAIPDTLSWLCSVIVGATVLDAFVDWMRLRHRAAKKRERLQQYGRYYPSQAVRVGPGSPEVRR